MPRRMGNIKTYLLRGRLAPRGSHSRPGAQHAEDALLELSLRHLAKMRRLNFHFAPEAPRQSGNTYCSGGLWPPRFRAQGRRARAFLARFTLAGAHDGAHTIHPGTTAGQLLPPLRRLYY